MEDHELEEKLQNEDNNTLFQTVNQHLEEVVAFIDHIDTQLQYVSHDARQEITLKDFLNKHNLHTNGLFKQYANQMLQQKIEGLLGKEVEARKDKNLGSVSTHPSQTELVDKNLGTYDEVNNYLAREKGAPNQKFQAFNETLDRYQEHTMSSAQEQAVYKDALLLVAPKPRF
mmetsp:Transcript_14534/g.22570  ORF Transcript_14534/g.22570 Transcript_14534/m.22570 type:complete len:172 (-) Transcript_14534:1526-2041(-)